MNIAKTDNKFDVFDYELKGIAQMFLFRYWIIPNEFNAAWLLNEKSQLQAEVITDIGSAIRVSTSLEHTNCWAAAAAIGAKQIMFMHRHPHREGGSDHFSWHDIEGLSKYGRIANSLGLHVIGYLLLADDSVFYMNDDTMQSLLDEKTYAIYVGSTEPPLITIPEVSSVVGNRGNA